MDFYVLKRSIIPVQQKCALNIEILNCVKNWFAFFIINGY